MRILGFTILATLFANPFIAAQDPPWSPTQWADALAEGRSIANGAPNLLADHFKTWLKELPDGESTQIQEDIDAIFRFAAGRVGSDERLNLANNYAVFLIKRQHFQMAANLLDELGSNLQALAPHDAARMHYNRARAHHLAGNLERALSAYKLAFETDPSYAQVPRKLFETAHKSKEPILWQAAMAMALELAAMGRSQAALRFMQRSLELEPELMAVAMESGLMQTTIKLFSSIDLSPAAYRKRWAPLYLNAWKRLELSFETIDASAASSLRKIAFRQFQVMHDAFTGGGFLKDTSLLPRAAVQRDKSVRDSRLSNRLLADFFKGVGKHYLRGDKYYPAVTLFTYAWDLNNFDTELGLYISNALVAGGREFDPDGKIFDGLIKDAFRGKGRAYSSGNGLLIYRFHVMLANAFMQRKIWDSSRRYHGARKQWNLAERWFRSLKRNPPKGHAHEFIQAPKLYQNLGLARDRSGKKQEAWKAYSTSAQHFVALGDSAEARKVFMVREAMARLPRNREEQILNRNLIADLFTPKDGNRAQANQLAAHVSWIASRGRIGTAFDFRNQNLSNYDFSGLNLQNTDFSGAKLINARFDQTNLTRANFKGTDLSGAQFRYTKIEGANFENAVLKEATLDRVEKKQIETQFSQAQINDMTMRRSTRIQVPRQNLQIDQQQNNLLPGNRNQIQPSVINRQVVSIQSLQKNIQSLELRLQKERLSQVEKEKLRAELGKLKTSLKKLKKDQ